MSEGVCRTRRAGILALLVLAAAVAGVWLSATVVGGPAKPPQIQGTVLPDGRELGSFRLVDDQGRPFTEADLRDRWTLLFFGYTHCPDVCPTSLSVLDRAWQWLETEPALRDNTQVVFVTVDPERDTPERLAQYLPHFNPAFRGVTGDKATLAALARRFAVGHSSEGMGNGLIDHTAATLLVGPDGRWRALFTAGTPPEALARDFVKTTAYLGGRV